MLESLAACHDLVGQVFSNPPVYDLIFYYLSPRTLIRLSRTCKITYIAVTDFFKCAYNINQHLSRYFPDPLSFRSLQARTGLVISGCNALQFLDRTLYPESDLDVYSHAGHVYEVLEWIESVGYKFQPHKDQGEDWHDHVSADWDGTIARVIRLPPRGEDVRSTRYSNIAEVYTFKRLVDIGAELVELHIHVIETICNPIDTIMKYHSTYIMNIITFDAAYSFYPIATFEDRSAVKIPGSRHRLDVLAKYVKRGWRVHSAFRPEDIAQPYKSPFLPNVTRWVGDRHCWTIPLDTSGVMPRTALSPSSEQFSWDPSAQNGWIMKTKPSTLNGLSIPEVDANPITTTIFRYNYIVPSESLALEIRGWAFCQGKLNHEILTRHNWTWFDAEIPGFREHVA